MAAEQPEKAYRPVSAELSLTETICLKHPRKVGRDNTVNYHWRVLQLLPGMDRPSYAGLQVEVLERGRRPADDRLPRRDRRFSGIAPAPCPHCGERPIPAPSARNSNPSLTIQPTATLATLSGHCWTLWNRPTRKRSAPKGSHQGWAWCSEAGSALVAPDAYSDPAGSLGGSAAGQEAGTLPAGHRPQAGHVTRSRQQIRPGGESPNQTTQRQGACQGRGYGRIIDRRGLARMTFSLFT